MAKIKIYTIADYQTAKEILATVQEVVNHEVPTEWIQWAEKVTQFFTKVYTYAKGLQGDWALRLKMAWDYARNGFQEVVSASDLRRMSSYVVGIVSKFAQDVHGVVKTLMRMTDYPSDFSFIKEDGSFRLATGRLLAVRENGTVLYDDVEAGLRSFRIERLITNDSNAGI